MKLAKSTKTIVGFVILLCAAVALLTVSKKVESFTTTVPVIGYITEMNITKTVGMMITGYALVASTAASEYKSMAGNAQVAFDYLKRTGIQVNVIDVATKQLILGHRDITLFVDDCLAILKSNSTNTIGPAMVTRIQKLFSQYNNATFNRDRLYAIVYNSPFTGVPVSADPNFMLALNGQSIVRMGTTKPIFTVAEIKKLIPNQSTSPLTIDAIKNQIRDSKGVVIFDGNEFMKLFSGQEQQKVSVLASSLRFCDYGIIDCQKK